MKTTKESNVDITKHNRTHIKQFYRQHFRNYKEYFHILNTNILNTIILLIYS